MNPIEERPTGRLTTSNAIYCQEKCGQARFCQRFAQGNLCFNARCYDRLRRDVLTDRQMEVLERHGRLGAVAFVCAGIRGSFFAVPWTRWQNMKRFWGRQSVTPGDLEPYRIKFDGAVRFLEYIHTDQCREAAGEGRRGG